jgi:hypothetical protein
MSRSRFPNSNDPSLIDARRTAAVARPTSALVILLGILAVGVMTACSPRMTSSPRVHEAVSATPAQSNDAAAAERSIEQMRLDPAELREYTMNVHG